MPWRAAYGLDIFAPAAEPYGENWVEQILGTTIKPIYERYQEQIRWLWVTRYANVYHETDAPGGQRLPERFRANGMYRFVAFRLNVSDDVRAELQRWTIELAQAAGCYPESAGLSEYDAVADLGGRHDRKLVGRRVQIADAVPVPLRAAAGS